MRWPVQGDDNENATVATAYRKKGADAWRQGYPLIRTIKAATGPQKGQWNFTKGNLGSNRLSPGRLYAGSIVDLEPETEYEVKLSLQDPDGGATEKILAMRTIGEPKTPPGMRERHVAPGAGGGSGAKEDPIKGLEEAFATAQPGDLFLLHAGTYAVKGTLNLPKGGTAEKPIVFRGAGDGEAILDGGGNEETKGRLISANGTGHVWLEDLTLQGRQYVIVAHEATNWVLRRCKFLKMEKGFTAHNGNYTRSRGHFISDNLFVGPTAWPRTKGIESYCGTYMSGSGHVVCYNRFEHVGDGMHGSGYGNLSASDIHNNDFNICTDDGLEADYSETNVRVYRNRIVNVAHGITAQPSQGGPLYFFRNVIYNATYSPFKLHNDTCGVLIFHNTCLRNGASFNIVPGSETVTEVVTRNNLFLGTAEAGLNTTGRMTRCDFDADGFGGYKGAFALWNGKTYKTADDARASGQIYANAGVVEIDPAACFASGLLPPADPQKEYKGDQLDVRLKEDGPAIDRGVVLPNFNDGFAGKAPDLGAIEAGQPLPHYGPRASAKQP
ncbi:MAG: right-handed parallel beta-helix repeat-containing protein [Planctomycetota bacterium]|nr:right-handed parallel beta-helix repeat-containing protein [Planctomycetota bacterium]